MPKRTIDQTRAQASARGDAIATLLFGAVLIIASVIVTLAETDVPKSLIGFGTFLAGVALSAWGSSELERLAAPRSHPEGNALSRSAHSSSPIGPQHLNHAGE